MNTILIQLDTWITQHVKIFNKTVLQAHKHLCRLIHLKTEDQRLKDADLSIYELWVAFSSLLLFILDVYFAILH